MMRVGWFLLAPALLAGCLFRTASVAPRFFAPGAVAAEHDPSPATEAAVTTGTPIHLRAVHGSAFLRQRIVWRISPVEYGQYEGQLWCELPATYVQRALGAALRRTPGLQLTDDVRAPALRVEVLAFDEVLAPAHAATVSLAASLRNGDGNQVLDDTFTADAPIAGSDPAKMAQAMGRALDEATAAVAVAVAAALHTR